MRPALPWSDMMMLHHSPEGVSTHAALMQPQSAVIGLGAQRASRLVTPSDSPSTMRLTFHGPSMESAMATIWSTAPPGMAETSTYLPLIL